jgi:uncharacterized membrane protein YkvA (DUF1232 family)
MARLWIAALAGASVLATAFIAGLWFSWKVASDADKTLVRRVMRLRIRQKLQFAVALTRDRRVPLRARMIPPVVVLYLASPLDIIPDFIPVIGQLDDVLVLAVGIRLLLGFTPRTIVEERLRELEGRTEARPNHIPDEPRVEDERKHDT